MSPRWLSRLSMVRALVHARPSYPSRLSPLAFERLLQLTLTLALSLTASALLLIALDSATVQALPLATVRPYPGSVSPCDTTLQACLSGSADGDSVLLSTGTYITLSLNITRAVSLIGGGANPAAVILHPISGRMIQYSTVPLTATYVISNLTVENGNSGGSSGGGIRVFSGAAPLFQSIVVSNNVGTGGGGIRIIPTVPATLVNVTVFSNTSFADGGGIHTSGGLTLVNSRVEGNSSAGNGGGVFAVVATTIIGGSFERNIASSTGGMGGGLLVSATLSVTGTHLLTNSANLGGGVYVSGTAIMTNAEFISNTAIGVVSSGRGGGLYVAGSAFLIAGRFERNATGHGGPEGGGVRVDGTLTITGTQFLTNTSGVNSHGGGVYVSGTVAMTNALFVGNSSTDGGGGAQVSGGTLNGTRFENNVASQGDGGGLRLFAGSISITNTLFISNSGSDGSALSLNLAGDSRIVNSLFARNHSTRGGVLQSNGAGNLAVLHNTMVDSGLNPLPAITVEGGAIGITDTIIVNHSIGISQTVGSVREDYNLFFGVGTPRLGTVTIGGHSVNGNPDFVNPAADNYHLGANSAAIDAGVDAGVAFDIDGQPRPFGGGFDIGYDEATFRNLFLPLIER